MIHNFIKVGTQFSHLCVSEQIPCESTKNVTTSRYKLVKILEKPVVEVKDKQGNLHKAFYCEVRGRGFIDQTDAVATFPRQVIGLDRGRPVMSTLDTYKGLIVIRRGNAVFKAERDDIYPWYHIGEQIIEKQEEVSEPT